MAIFDRQLMPTSTVHQERLSIYQPTRRPKYIDREIVNATADGRVTGRVRVLGRLGQQHADVIESMFYTAEGRGLITDSDGNQRIKMLIDPYRVRAVARQHSGTTLRRVLDDIMSAVIEIREPEHLRCLGHLIDHVDIATRRDGTKVLRPCPMYGERDMWRVVIGRAAMHLIGADMSLYFDPAPIAEMRHGISQAVTRLALTHDPARQPNGGWRLDTLIQQVCLEINDSQMWDRRREVRADAEAMAKVGVYLSTDGERIHLEQKHGARVKTTRSLEQKHDRLEHKHGEMGKSGA